MFLILQCDSWLVGMIILATQIFIYRAKDYEMWHLLGPVPNKYILLHVGNNICRSELLNATFNNILVNCAALHEL